MGIKGILELGIGDNFTKLFQLPGIKGECVKYRLGVVGAHIKGISLYFQSVVLNPDPKKVRFPLMTSNICSTLYK